MLNPNGLSEQLIRMIPDLMVFARVRAPSSDLAEDLVQETITKMLELDREFRRAEIRPYAFTVLKNLIADHYRARPNELIEFEEIEDNSQFHIEVQRLLEALGQLGENCQSVLSLAGLGNTQREISNLLNQPIGTIGSWLSRCRRKLTEVMGL
ncbi:MULTISPECIES: RNA polymerase sigma factor [unclassified Marinobacterium]|uniref:RNA polymerase sigma factor n=1 Tax=unclassified Marinobacterium TaxID=2644139 RepID=UPI0015691B6D|nr:MULTISPECIES: sigma-70 family RNA polymerase sigma factor [unclassified Marinobacterium]NRP52353.1 ECF RNA polymerase sigma factor SigR [Marinobacterium sp. xm-v-242]NRP76934.1 ECF RNA polymerase sigma factor SigR [Marinobacterium sp. xm-m-383]